MVLFPNAKINIGLFVTGKRDDGYHSIESLFVPLPLYDVLEAVMDPDNQDCTLMPSGMPVQGSLESNLVYRAWEVMHDKYKIGGVRAALRKQIPMGAGLGGGSSDGASMLLILNKLFDLNLSAKALEELAARLGSDCPFFIQNQPAFVSGRGERVEQTSLDLSGLHFVLVHPGVHIGTAEAYRLIKPAKADFDLRQLNTFAVEEWQTHAINDFQHPVAEKYSEVAQALELLKHLGAAYISLSGSGSAVYGLFRELPEQPEDFPAEWTWHSGSF
jgi:4-diphosphocytidyl-2-C-methyl-D-erythritol kinase